MTHATADSHDMLHMCTVEQMRRALLGALEGPAAEKDNESEGTSSVLPPRALLYRRGDQALSWKRRALTNLILPDDAQQQLPCETLALKRSLPLVMQEELQPSSEETGETQQKQQTKRVDAADVLPLARAAVAKQLWEGVTEHLQRRRSFAALMSQVTVVDVEDVTVELLSSPHRGGEGGGGGYDREGLDYDFVERFEENEYSALGGADDSDDDWELVPVEVQVQ